MTRKSEDLLDLFRSAPRRSSGGRASSGSSGRATGGGTGRTGRRELSVTLGRRHLLLGGASVALAVVLAFVAGIGIGRGKGAGAAPAAVRLTSTPHMLVSAPVPRVGLRGEDLPSLLRDDLHAKHPEFDGRLQFVYPTDEHARASGAVCLKIGGFPDRQTAQAVQFQLAIWGLTGAGFPFQTAVPEPER
jgi:hypothetical protein